MDILNAIGAFFTPQYYNPNYIPHCLCDPITDAAGNNFSPFIGEAFKICAYSKRDVIAFTLGLAYVFSGRKKLSPTLEHLCYLFTPEPLLTTSFPYHY